MPGPMKTKTAQQRYSEMRRDTENVNVRNKVKIRSYRGYTIKEWEPLKEGAEPICIIGLNNIGLAARRGIQQSHIWINEEIKRKESHTKRITIKKPRRPSQAKEILSVTISIRKRIKTK